MSTTTLPPAANAAVPDDDAESMVYCECCNPAPPFTYKLKALPSQLKGALMNEKAFAYLHDHCLICPCLRYLLTDEKCASLPSVTTCENACCRRGYCEPGDCFGSECCEFGCCIEEGHDLCKEPSIALRSWTWLENSKPPTRDILKRQSTLDSWLLTVPTTSVGLKVCPTQWR